MCGNEPRNRPLNSGPPLTLGTSCQPRLSQLLPGCRLSLPQGASYSLPSPPRICPLWPSGALCMVSLPLGTRGPSLRPSHDSVSMCVPGVSGNAPAALWAPPVASSLPSINTVPLLTTSKCWGARCHSNRDHIPCYHLSRKGLRWEGSQKGNPLPPRLLFSWLSLPWPLASMETGLRLPANQKRPRPRKDSKSFPPPALSPLSY